MANLVRRTGERNLPSFGIDPLRLMRDMMGWDPFREMIPWTPGGEEALSFTPEFDVKETKEAYIFKADLPGVADKDLDITLTGNRLTISGRREAEQRQEGESYYTYERSFGSFSRSFTLPEGVDPDSVDAKLDHGVLAVRVAKKPEVQPKKISLTGGGLGEKVKSVLGGKEKEKPSA